MAMVIADPVLGWRKKPGVFKARNQDIEWTWDIAENGYRRLINAPKTFRKRAWFFGCSFTEGHCVNIEHSFCYHLQERFEDTQITPYAIGGYSSFQNLLQLEANLVTAKPDVVVFGYFHYHLMRNVSDPALWRQGTGHPACRKTDKDSGAGRHFFRPAALLSEKGRLRYRRIYLPHSKEEMDGMMAYAPDQFTQYRVGELIMQRAKRRTEAAGGKFYVAVLRVGDAHQNIQNLTVPTFEDPFISRLVNKGIDVIDAVPQRPFEETTFYPVDGHPNAAAHLHFSQTIGDALSGDLS